MLRTVAVGAKPLLLSLAKKRLNPGPDNIFQQFFKDDLNDDAYATENYQTDRGCKDQLLSATLYTALVFHLDFN